MQTPFKQEIFPGYQSANVSPEGSAKRRRTGFSTVSLDGKPTAFVHVFVLAPMHEKSAATKKAEAAGGGCDLCKVAYKKNEDGQVHIKSKKHKFNATNDKQWKNYLLHLYPRK